METTKELAATFVRMQQHGDKLDEIAAPFLRMAKELEIKTVAELNEWVYSAYDANKWSYKPGRPFADQEETPAPDVVKLYVSTFRSALKHGMAFAAFDTIGAMRNELRKTKTVGPSHANGPERIPELRGIQLANDSKLTGAFCHDIAVYTRVLPEDKRLEMEDRVRKVMKRYAKYVREALAADEQKAA